jgi:hypothetical protein
MRVDNEIWKPRSGMKENSNNPWEKQPSMMIGQCELFSVVFLMVRKLSMQSNAPAHL